MYWKLMFSGYRNILFWTAPIHSLKYVAGEDILFGLAILKVWWEEDSSADLLIDLSQLPAFVVMSVFLTKHQCFILSDLHPSNFVKTVMPQAKPVWTLRGPYPFQNVLDLARIANCAMIRHHPWTFVPVNRARHLNQLCSKSGQNCLFLHVFWYFTNTATRICIMAMAEDAPCWGLFATTVFLQTLWRQWIFTFHYNYAIL